MATVRKTAEKQANAVEEIQKASAALAKQFKLDIEPFPDVRRFDPEFGKAVQLEWAAGILTQVADATKAKAKPEKEAANEETDEKKTEETTKEDEVIIEPKSLKGKK